ncbi:hypothetical protein H0H93_010028 [Arthromyces matolae]|nr:hypothetical protein H0H93_010028 [Arthromyces matolae]
MFNWIHKRPYTPHTLIMRLALTFLLSSLALSTAVGAVKPNPIQRFPAKTQTSSNVVADRQFRIRRALIDTCVDVKGSALASILGVFSPTLNNLEICLCLSDLNVWLQTNVAQEILSLVPGLTSSVLGTAINTLIGITGTGCTSSGSRKRNLPKQAVTTLFGAQQVCKSKTVCGLAGREGTKEFECVDTQSTLDSCGGCTVAHPFQDNDKSPATGVDCSRLPGAVNARCSESKCVVTKCRKGLQPSFDGTACVSTKVILPRQSLNVDLNGLVNQVLDILGLGGLLQLGPGSTTPKDASLLPVSVALTNLLSSKTISDLLNNLVILLQAILGSLGQTRDPAVVKTLSAMADRVRSLQASINNSPDLQGENIEEAFAKLRKQFNL